jgi:FkbM family methyltransferase
MYSFINLREIAAWDRFELEALCRAQSQSAYLGDHIGLCRMLGRYKFYVDTRDRGFGSNILLDGFWEMWLTQFMARYVKPGMVVADVGAGYGYFSILLADLVGPTGHVYAVEPNPQAALWLRRSLQLNGFAGNTTVCEAAAGDGVTGAASLRVRHDEPMNATIVPEGECVAAPDAVFHEIACCPLSALTAAHDRIDFLKIDTGGGEEGILRGMARMLERRPAMVLTFNARRFADPAGFVARLVRHYPALKLVDHSGNAVPITEAELLDEGDGEDRLLFLEP